MERFRGGLAFKAHRLLYHSSLGSRVIQKKKKIGGRGVPLALGNLEEVGEEQRPGFRVQGSGYGA